MWVGLDLGHGAYEELEVMLGWSSGLSALSAQDGVELRERTETPGLSCWSWEVRTGVAWELGEEPGLFKKPQKQGLARSAERGQRAGVTFTCPAFSHLPPHCSPCEHWQGRNHTHFTDQRAET